MKDLPCNFVTTAVAYDLQQPISPSIFNLKKFVSSITIDQFLIDPSIIVCNCVDSPFKDSYHGHIGTGDLRIIKDNKLRNICTKGTKYQEPRKIDFDQAKQNIINATKKYILRRYDITKTCL